MGHGLLHCTLCYDMPLSYNKGFMKTLGSCLWNSTTLMLRMRVLLQLFTPPARAFFCQGHIWNIPTLLGFIPLLCNLMKDFFFSTRFKIPTFHTCKSWDSAVWKPWITLKYQTFSDLGCPRLNQITKHLFLTVSISFTCLTSCSLLK